MSPLTITQAPDGRGYLWGLGDGTPSIFPDIRAAHRAMRAAERMSDVVALTALAAEAATITINAKREA